MKAHQNASEIARLIQVIDEAYNKKSWHGTNLRGSVRGLSPAQAGWRPGPGKHSIAEIVVHAAYWKYSARRRLRNDPRGSFPLKGSNWFTPPQPLSTSAWRECVALLDAEHRALRAAVAELTPGRLDQAPVGRKIPNRMLIRGIALHDVYHAGQIQLIKGLHKARKPRRTGRS
jgi:uncharacterized damage-inducible protein DinB